MTETSVEPTKFRAFLNTCDPLWGRKELTRLELIALRHEVVDATIAYGTQQYADGWADAAEFYQRLYGKK